MAPRSRTLSRQPQDVGRALEADAQFLQLVPDADQRRERRQRRAEQRVERHQFAGGDLTLDRE
jgi:hypothetical protein